MKKLLSLIMMVLIMVTMIVFTGISLAQSEAERENLTIAIHTDENTLTPFTYVRGYPGIEVMRLIYDSLFAMDKDNEPIPWMAKEYDVDSEFKVFSMTLHDNLQWHDGVKVTSEDVQFAFTYALDQNSSRWKRIASQIEQINIKDELSFEIVLKEASPNFIVQALADFPIYPKHIYQDIAKAEEAQVTIGSGPYQLVEYKPGQYYRFTRVDDYFMGTPRVKNIVMPIMKDTGSIFQALRAGQIDATTAHLAPELISGFSNDSKIKIKSGPGLTTTLLQLNNEVYPFNVKEFRQAVAHAIDTEDLVQTVLLGYGDRGSLGFFHPGLSYGMKELVFDRDISRSNELLDSLGFTEKNQQGIRLDKDGRALEFELLVGANNPIRIRTAEVIAEQLKEVGIGVKLVSLEANTLDDLVWPGFDVTQGRNYQMAMWGWSAPTQMRPDALVELFASDTGLGTLNIGAYKSSSFDELVRELQNTLNPESRLEIIKKMQLAAADEVPFVTLYYPQVAAAYNKDAYDGYVMQKGVGIINKFSFLPGDGLQDGSQAADNETGAAKEGKQGTPWYWAVIIVVLLIIGAKGLKLKKNAN
ncbi:ABC transporter substrate-binding protein [Desulfitibacter alkalitolerans]|uniref:ABC transporter substrate-binding protein n=1 Tax=Desulfitibacter alkalitolerans TaxID=264641 RepID=UPI00068646DD|nr:ABC transporter substrate-binding protein [Desulfitibacter alkalitolerans]